MTRKATLVPEAETTNAEDVVLTDPWAQRAWVASRAGIPALALAVVCFVLWMGKDLASDLVLVLDRMQHSYEKAVENQDRLLDLSLRQVQIAESLRQVEASRLEVDQEMLGRIRAFYLRPSGEVDVELNMDEKRERSEGTDEFRQDRAKLHREADIIVDGLNAHLARKRRETDASDGPVAGGGAHADRQTDRQPKDPGG